MGIRHFYGENQWAAWIMECQESGMGVKEWCEMHGLRDNLFFRWRRRLRERGILKDGSCVTDPGICGTAQASVPEVVEIKLNEKLSSDDIMMPGRTAAERISASGIMIGAPSGGFHIFVGEGFSKDVLKEVLEVTGLC